MTDLSPAAVPADHVSVCHGAEEGLGLQVLGEAGEKLSDVDEVHLHQDVLVQTQDAQPRPKQTLLPVSAENVPDPTRHVQREGLTVQSEDPKPPGGGRLRFRENKQQKTQEKFIP